MCPIRETIPDFNWPFSDDSLVSNGSTVPRTFSAADDAVITEMLLTFARWDKDEMWRIDASPSWKVYFDYQCVPRKKKVDHLPDRFVDQSVIKKRDKEGCDREFGRLLDQNEKRRLSEIRQAPFTIPEHHRTTDLIPECAIEAGEYWLELIDFQAPRHLKKGKITLHFSNDFEERLSTNSPTNVSKSENWRVIGFYTDKNLKSVPFRG